MLEDGDYDRGAVNVVQRIGDTIRRPTGPWTPAVHALLAHLESHDFPYAPRPLGLDADGREILGFLPGKAALNPWPPVLRTDAGIVALATMVRAYHTAVQGFVPPPNARWFVPEVAWQPGQIIRHGDWGPWNTIWQEERLVGLIDWDFCEPGTCLEELAQVAWYCVPLRGADRIGGAGFTEMPNLRARLHLLCATYDTTPALVVAALTVLQRKEMLRTTTLAQRGLYPWTHFRARGDVEEFTAEAAWLTAHTAALV